MRTVAWGTSFQMALKNCSEEAREKLGYKGILQQRAGSWEHQNVVVQSLSHVWFFATSWTAAHQASLSFTLSQSLLRLVSIVSIMPSNHLILCCPLLLLPSIFPSIRVFSNASALCFRWPKYWSFRFRIKRLLLINENQICQVTEFSAFLCMERCKSLGSLKSFRWSWGAIWGQYPVFSHPGFPQGLPLHIGEAQLLMTVKSFFTDRAGNIPFLTSIQNSNSTILQYKIKIKTQKKTPK